MVMIKENSTEQRWENLKFSSNHVQINKYILLKQYFKNDWVIAS